MQTVWMQIRLLHIKQSYLVGSTLSIIDSYKIQHNSNKQQNRGS